MGSVLFKFENWTGIRIEELTFHQAIIKCWTADAIPKLKPIIQALPAIYQVLWEFPTADRIKVNTDGASRGNLGRSAIGFVMRNEEGDVIYACDCMIVKNAMEGEWSAPWSVAREVEEIKQLMSSCNVTINHTVTEGNKLADHLANYALDIGPIESNCFGQMDIQGRRIVNDDKSQCP
ncbi:uncharacterized protein LOC142166468 [Nicotiana tabacum]|uniref:Uncharacterized protein LOC142166468 n=1 Tax=Nicotiana tabacum TaxID=4097 RepID=A0AC58SAE5_TOBAC